MVETLSFKHLILQAMPAPSELLEASIQLNPVGVDVWQASWAWSLPLIVLNVILHVFSLVFINEKVVPVLSGAMERRRFVLMAAVIIGVTALLATVLHAIEAGAWAVAYRLLGALPDNKVVRSAPDKLRPCGAVSGTPMATDGRSGGVERDAFVWPNHRLFVRHNPKGLVAEKQRTLAYLWPASDEPTVTVVKIHFRYLAAAGLRPGTEAGEPVARTTGSG